MGDQISVSLIVEAISKGFDQISSNMDGIAKSNEKAAQSTKQAGNAFTELNSAISIAKQAYQVLNDVMAETVGFTVEYAGQVRTLSRTIGASAEESSKLIQAADDVGISYNTLQTAMESAIRKGVEPSIDGIASLSEEYNSIADPIARTKFLMDNFGRAGADLAPLMEKGAEGIREMGQAAEEAGLIMDEKAVVAARNYEIAMDDLGDTANATKITIGNQLIPPLTSFLQIINELNKKKMDTRDAVMGIVPPLGAINSLMRAREALDSIGEAEQKLLSKKVGGGAASIIQAALNPTPTTGSTLIGGGPQFATATGKDMAAALLANDRLTSRVSKETLDYATSLNKATQAADRAAKQQKEYGETLKWIDDQTGQAQERLNQAQQNWMDNIGGQMAGKIEGLAGSGQKYADALGIIDQVMGTNLATQYQMDQSMNKLAQDYARTGNKEELQRGLEALKQTWMAQDEGVKQAQQDLDKFKKMWDTLSDKTVNLLLNVYTNYPTGAPPGGITSVGAVTGGGRSAGSTNVSRDSGGPVMPGLAYRSLVPGETFVSSMPGNVYTSEQMSRMRGGDNTFNFNASNPLEYKRLAREVAREIRNGGR